MTPPAEEAVGFSAPLHSLTELLDTALKAPGLAAAMAAVDKVRREQLGEGLLTVSLRTDEGRDASADSVELQRVWTSDPAAYPVAGRKRKNRTAWTRQLLERAEVFTAEGAAALAAAFDDHALIASLGLRSIVNVPLLDLRGDCFATFNLLTTRDRWQPQEVLLVRLLALVATPAAARAAAQHRPSAP